MLKISGPDRVPVPVPPIHLCSFPFRFVFVAFAFGLSRISIDLYTLSLALRGHQNIFPSAGTSVHVSGIHGLTRLEQLRACISCASVYRWRGSSRPYGTIVETLRLNYRRLCTKGERECKLWQVILPLDLHFLTSRFRLPGSLLKASACFECWRVESVLQHLQCGNGSD